MQAQSSATLDSELNKIMAQANQLTANQGNFMAMGSSSASKNEKTISKIILEKVAKQKLEKAKKDAAEAQNAILAIQQRAAMAQKEAEEAEKQS